MTITTRSKRVSMFGAAPTPSAVGPGAYAPEKTSTSFKVENRQMYSGFATSNKRDLNANKTTSAMTPGPGAYLGPQASTSPTAASSNVFATKISRFAPSAPGSTIFRPSSIQDNPGPGAYAVEPVPPPPKTSPRSNQHEDRSHPQRFVAAHHRPSVPTIPKKEQSYGYVEGENGALKLQAQPAAIYTGIGQDTVGPAAYNSHAEIWNDRKNVAPSLKSTVKREVWEADTPRRAVPGPGQYESSVQRRSHAKARQSAVFASKVPILPDPKPVTHHDDEREFEILAKEQRLLQRGGAKPPMTNKVEAFGSTTGRTDLLCQLNAPFSSPTFLKAPGPGQYAERTRVSVRGGTLKKGSSRSQRGLAYREYQCIGFTSATERYCLTKLTPSALPGPGAYRSETPRTVERTVKGKQTVGRFGVFGSTSERHVWENLERLEAEDITPGPGAYEKPVETHGGHFPMMISSSAFKSSSSRFARVANPHAPPHVVCVGEQATPAVGQYNINTSTLAPPGSPQDYDGSTSPLPSARAPFMSNAERRVFDPQEARYVPGPGQYVVHDDPDDPKPHTTPMTRSREVRATLGNDTRFRVKPVVPEHVGPGSYSIPGTVGTTSFNVTMKANNKA
ncbi:hypothetical protein Poli38472_006809 [Pythium oligandrum]|uniref:Sperm-tail PG-rich repeat n=1 Tax=Pythium oligandrum TaxID=41045 RepID=A0A8K1C591_PYTOL|nr:hypothetical protein Poli38472_006809 [Pythium oligandrum]|eukprot:TMW56799.1 hypothetical protein Poli38472_006809 [Pythium oligandrum]